MVPQRGGAEKKKGRTHLYIKGNIWEGVCEGFHACKHLGKERKGMETSEKGTVPKRKKRHWEMVHRNQSANFAFPAWMGKARNRE